MANEGVCLSRSGIKLVVRNRSCELTDISTLSFYFIHNPSVYFLLCNYEFTYSSVKFIFSWPGMICSRDACSIKLTAFVRKPDFPVNLAFENSYLHFNTWKATARKLVHAANHSSISKTYRSIFLRPLFRQFMQPFLFLPTASYSYLDLGNMYARSHVPSCFCLAC